MKKKVSATTASTSKIAAKVVPENSMETTEVLSYLSPEKPRFPIVGIGASAGGLEAIGQFLAGVPSNSGMAFVVVQHLDPTLVGMLPELLRRSTTMTVVQVADQTRVEPNCVYVIPPNADMSILHGVLHLLAPTAPRGLRLPIDFFFRALAEDQQERSVGVILSGMGTDGTIGLGVIKEHGGLTLVQDPASAKFDGMPGSAIRAGLSDITVPAIEIPSKILEFLNHVPSLSVKTESEAPEGKSHIEVVILLLRSHTGHDFSLYKRSTIYRRIERRMGIHKLSKILDYVRYLRENPQEIDLLFKELLIGVTSFFRDPVAWDRLQDEVLPKLFANRKVGTVLRAWVAGCSTGEEAYSLAILFKETMESLKLLGNKSVQIFATDLDAGAVDQARLGCFPPNVSADVSPERLKRFFVEEQNGYRITKEIREMVIFASQNLIMDPPFTKLDVLTCRNLLIYLSSELQKKLISLFAYSLNPGGVLMLGNAESIGEFTDEFESLKGKSRIFLRQKSADCKVRLELPATRVSDSSDSVDKSCEANAAVAPSNSLQFQAEQWLMKHHAPSAALVNDQGDILYISGRTGRYLEPASGKANWNIFVMARGGIAYELTSAFQKARRQKDPVVVRCFRDADDTERSQVELSVQFIPESGVLEGLTLIVFSEVAIHVHESRRRAGKASISNDKIIELESQLAKLREELQRTRDDMRTSQEELKSLNEEHQSTNEELQSTNEELTTSKEEMQSLNEELQTVNAELQAKLDELSATSNDMKNLLNSTEIATVFLDNSLKVRRYTEHVNQIIKLIPGDIGRPVTDLAISLIYPDLANDAREVLRTLIPLDKSLVSQGGRWFATRLMPYRTFDNRISGIVITFTDMTVVKKLEAELYASKRRVN